MLPQYQRLDGTRPKFLIPFGKFSLHTVALPLCSFIFCVVCSILFDFDNANDTHCHVYNFLPSISAAIGNYQPQRFVWTMAITLHALPRFFIALFYHRRYQELIKNPWTALARLAFLLNVIENVCLLGLTYFTSVHNYSQHKFFFVTFIVTSETYMAISYVLNKWLRRKDVLTTVDIRSIKFKGALFMTNLISFALAGYCFMRHNWYCEPGVYSLFALFEYIVVLTNMGFHMTSYWDFSGQSFAFDSSNWFYLTSM